MSRQNRGMTEQSGPSAVGQVLTDMMEQDRQRRGSA
jgi:hypothetical protein